MDRSDREQKLPFEDSISFDNDTNFKLHGSGYALTFLFGLYQNISGRDQTDLPGQALIMGVGAALFLGRSMAADSRRAREQEEKEMEEVGRGLW